MPESQDRSKLIQQAAAHHARLASKRATAADRRKLADWLDRGKFRREVFSAMDGLGHFLSWLGGVEGRAWAREHDPGLASLIEDARKPCLAVRQTDPVRRRKPRALALAASLVFALVVTMMLVSEQVTHPESTAYRTHAGERITVVLSDGSTLDINGDSQASVTINEDERQVTLVRGRLFLDVAPEADRPFRTIVGAHLITVTGTAFDLSYRDGLAQLTVAEGQVLVDRVAHHAAPPGERGLERAVALNAGQQLELRYGAAPVNLDPAVLRASLEWREGWLHFDDETLETVVRELQPHVTRPIVIADHRTASLRLSGSFNVERLDSLFGALESLLPVTVAEREGHILIEHSGAE